MFEFLHDLAIYAVVVVEASCVLRGDGELNVIFFTSRKDSSVSAWKAPLLDRIEILNN